MSDNSSIGKGITICGLAMCLISIVYILVPLGIIGLFVACLGLIDARRSRKRETFLAKGGGQIHSCEIWKKGTESGLFLTTCGLVVSINQESRETGHFGYRIVPTKRATCSECCFKEGKAIIDSASHGGREHPMGF